MPRRYKWAKPPRGWFPIFNGAYAVGPRGRVMRLKPGRGARPGHVLKPWRPERGSDHYYRLCDGDKTMLVTVRLMATRHRVLLRATRR